VVVLPAGWSKEGLPIGVQLVGQRWKDEQLLAIAASLDDHINDLRHPPDFRASNHNEGERSD
jgi:amidase